MKSSRAGGGGEFRGIMLRGENKEVLRRLSVDDDERSVDSLAKEGRMQRRGHAEIASWIDGQEDDDEDSDW